MCSFFRQKLLLLMVGVWGGATLQPALAQTAYNMQQMQREELGRGVVAVRQPDGSVFVSWRYLSSDGRNEAFHVYRNGERITTRPIRQSTCFVDENPFISNSSYAVYPVTHRGVKAGGSYRIKAADGVGYVGIPLQKPAPQTMPDGRVCTYSANDAIVADVDGDGVFEVILKWYPSNWRDNSQDGYTGTTMIDCYRLTGQMLWRIDLGRNIRSGAHYTQMVAYDLDGDNRAELVLKTADGTIDGVGKVIGDSLADYRNGEAAKTNRRLVGRIVEGAEYLTVFNGLTGAAMCTVPYNPPRGDIRSWGDGYANRCDRFGACVAFLDGQHPSVVQQRGYYTRTVFTAYDWDGRELTQRWVFDTNQPQWNNYAAQGDHSLRVGDVDADGCDEILLGSCTIDHDGTGLYTTGRGHGDALHLTVFHPDSTALWLWNCHENRRDGSSMSDARSGKMIWQVKSNEDVGRCLAADIDPTHPGLEVWSWASGGLRTYLGEVICPLPKKFSCNMAVWWDGDLSRELLDHEAVSKFNPSTQTCQTLIHFDGCEFNNGTKSNPCLAADVLGDWREEVITRTVDSGELRIYVSTLSTKYRFHTFLEDPIYRLSVVTQNVGYNQPTQPGFYFGSDLKNGKWFRGCKMKK